LRATLLVCLAAGAVFSPALWGPFHLDDFALWNDVAVTSPSGWADCWRFGQTRPLTWFSFWLNYQAAGQSPFPWRLFNLLLHLASVAVLRDALRRVLPEHAATIAAALFALHPIQTEAVSYVFARATLWMTLFCLLSLRAWWMGRRWAAAVWFVPALLSKEECVALPLALALLDRRITAPLGAMLGLSMAAGLRVLHAASVTAGSGAGAQSAASPVEYLLTQGVAILRYLRLLVLPTGFSIESPVDAAGAWTGALAWVAVLAAAGWSLRAGRWFAAAFLLLLPSSSIFPADDLAADRRMYLPLALVSAGAAPWIARLAQRWQAAILLVLAVLTFRQAILWADGEALWREAVRLAPHRVRPRVQLARQLAPDRALAVLDEARMIAPEDPRVASEQGRVLLEIGQPERALAEFGRALALNPGDASAINNRGVALWKLGQVEAARADFQRALQVDPGLADARRNLDRLNERR
jgi:tetratricopeptide (TPR) repeat protein